ncbi:restriction endonuclease [Methylocystis sp. Sn-Cys]|uniref:restriction endonuclease n=1 Tax=Methylocystis sp. Sn-Cys TaxID=1701263 RepID=UPI001FED5981|nr:restriction endonuclease [Methylocystis sp. Sn-Cys]
MVETWMVRAGEGGYLFDEFRQQSIVAIGWGDVGPATQIMDKSGLWEQVKKARPEMRDQAVSMSAGQIWRFAKEMKIGDRVVTYDPRARFYLCGTIAGECEFFPDAESKELFNRRQVNWVHEKGRDDLSVAAQNSLGAISTIFLIPPAVSDELWSLAPTENSAAEIMPDSKESIASFDPSADQIGELASEKIKDRIAKLSWSEMQQLVAALLQAMGYKTTVSPAGTDRGKDILASPDGFGFQEPRIAVEVKHRPGTRIGAPEIRSFVGGRRPHECGLYVSTGGFSQEAYYEAERSTIPLTLIDFEKLVAAVLINYPAFDERTRQLLPLQQIYWPL